MVENLAFASVFAFFLHCIAGFIGRVWMERGLAKSSLRSHQSTFPFVLKLIVFKCCCSVDFFITSSFPPFLQLLGRNVISLKACELTFWFRSKDLNICISPSLAVVRTGSNVNFTQTASHWSKCLNIVDFFCAAKHFWIHRAEYLQVFPLRQYEDSVTHLWRWFPGSTGLRWSDADASLAGSWCAWVVNRLSELESLQKRQTGDPVSHA